MMLCEKMQGMESQIDILREGYNTSLNKNAAGQK